MHALATQHLLETTTKTEQSGPDRCTQCGERLDTTSRRARPTRATLLCVDCAFEDMPCTD